MRFGMTREEVRRAIGAKPHTFEKASSVLVDAYYEHSFQVFFDKSDKVDFIEVSGARSVRVSVHGVFPLELPATEALAKLEVAVGEGPVPEDRFGFSFIVPTQEIALWRAVVPETPGDKDGMFFDTLAFAVQGYFSGRLDAARQNESSEPRS